MHQKISVEAPAQQRRKKLTKRNIFIWLAVVTLFAGALVFGGWSPTAGEDLNSVEVIQSKVSRHMLLPDNETPALATVIDEKKLSTKLLNDAKNGDKVLIYQEAGRVIVYRPSVDRIVGTRAIDILPLDEATDR